MKLAKLDGMVAFAAVAEARSFTSAAARLEVTAAALSQAVKQLESRLGVRLLHRTTRSVGLTEAGQHFLERVGPAIRELLDASAALDEYRDEAAGLLRLNTSAIVHAMLLRPLLPGFLAAHPRVQMEVALNDGFVDIVAEGFDAGVRLGESVQLDMVTTPLTQQERTCIVASPAYAARKGLPDSIEALRAHDCVRYRFPASGSIYRWELLRDGALVEVEIAGSLTVNDSVSMAQAALDGIGLAYVFERQVKQDIAAGKLLPVLPDAWPTLSGFHLYYPHRKHMPAKLRAFIDYCKAHLN